METEILRGAKVRVTTTSVRVGDRQTALAGLSDFTFAEADHALNLAPKILLVLGPLLGAALYLITTSFAASAGAGVAVMAVGVWRYRESWLHHVSAKTGDARRITLYRTSRKADALLFHAALAKAKEMREQQREALRRSPCAADAPYTSRHKS
jgi:hypothetical protein